MTAAFAIVAALLALGAGVIAAFGGSVKSTRSELWRHYGATVLMAAAVLVPAALHPALFAAVAALAAWRAALELAHLARLTVSSAASVCVAAGAIGAVAFGRAGDTLMVVTLACLAASAPVYAAAMRRPSEGLSRWPFALVFPLLAAAHLSLLAHAGRGFAWICLLYVVVETQDSMAFLVGRLFGRRPLAPHLSPRKTLEGAIGGALAGCAAGVLIGVLLLGLSSPLALVVALFIAAAGFAGDLFTSALKRAAGVKDFMPLHTRHGGVVDIYDSTLFAAIALGPLAWLTAAP